MRRMGVNASCQADVGVGPQAIFSAHSKRRHQTTLANLHKRLILCVSGDKKKRHLTTLATLRKRLIRRRRSSKSCHDHARVIRDLTQDWAIREVAALYEEYEASNALKDLTVQVRKVFFFFF
ncbi:BTB/POZ domain-containing protein 7 [Chionoecetes opilio]|uniref:BTB/POZ domain-containing protein 7 n=1 Tax=Chionoecetes opilio TaxID=41210 RepID=A0A8J4YG30_CHIOP|nr:BTB/POZ domain-containing protein 7 [Chionoecetes opilio]